MAINDLVIKFYLQQLENGTITKLCAQTIFVPVQPWRRGCSYFLNDATTQETQGFSRDFCKRAGIRWRDGADQVVNLRGALIPIDATIFRLAAREIGALRQV